MNAHVDAVSISVAYLPDPVKFGKKGYPKPGVRQRLSDEGKMKFRRVSCADIKRGLNSKVHNVLLVPGEPHSSDLVL